MDMMFNTERIVKDMKGGKEDMTEITVKVNTRELTRQLNDLDLLQYQPYELGEFIKENLKVVKIGSSEDICFYLSLEKGGV